MGELPSVVLTLALLNEKGVALAPASATRLGRMLKRRPRRKAAPARTLSEEVLRSCPHPSPYPHPHPHPYPYA